MCYFHLEVQGLDGSANHGGGEPNWRGETSSGLVAGLDLLLLTGLLQDAREMCGHEGFVCVICTSQKQNLWMISDTFGWNMADFSAAKIPVRISEDLGS